MSHRADGRGGDSSHAAGPPRSGSARSRALRVGVAELLGHPGERRELRTTVVFDDLALTAARVEPDAEIDVELELEATLGGRLTVTGEIRAPWAGECRRCLEPVGGELVSRVREVFTDPHAEDASDPDLLPIENAHVDLEPVVREAVLLGLPLAPLCREDCPGPAPDRFPAVAADRPTAPEGGPDEVPGDPRWAALDDLRFDE